MVVDISPKFLTGHQYSIVGVRMIKRLFHTVLHDGLIQMPLFHILLHKVSGPFQEKIMRGLKKAHVSTFAWAKRPSQIIKRNYEK